MWDVIPIPNPVPVVQTISLYTARVVPALVADWDELPEFDEIGRVLGIARGQGADDLTMSASADVTVMSGSEEVSCSGSGSGPVSALADPKTVRSHLGTVLDGGFAGSWSGTIGGNVAGVSLTVLWDGTTARARAGGGMQFTVSGFTISGDPVSAFVAISMQPTVFAPDAYGTVDILGTDFPFYAALNTFSGGSIDSLSFTVI